MSRLRRALKFTFAQEYGSQLLQFVSVVILSRLLTPAEIGTFSVAAAVLFLASALRTYGVAQYIVRERELSGEKIRQATAVVFLMAWGLGTLIVVLAPLFADFYGEPGLQRIFWLTAFGFVLTPFIAVPYACLQREMQFDKTIRVRYCAALTQVVVSIGLAYDGYGYMSLAWGVTVGACTECIVVNIYRPSYAPWWPTFAGCRRIFAFGTYTGLTNVLERFSEGVPDLVLGRVTGMADVGVFSRGFGVVMLFTRVVTLAVKPVILPHFSRAHQAGEGLSEIYLRAVQYQTALAWPFFACFAVCTLPIVRILYGDQWDSSVILAQVLVVFGLAQAVYCYSNEALVAVGWVKPLLATETSMFFLRMLCVFIGAVSGGTLGAASGLAVAAAIEGTVRSCVVANALGFDVLRWLRFVWASGAVALTVAVVSKSTSQLALRYAPDNMWVQAVFVAGSGAMTWFAALFVFRHPLYAEVVAAMAHIRRTALGQSG